MILTGDCHEIMEQMERDSVDLIFGSPPYEDARTYGIDFSLSGQDWVDWMVGIWEEMDLVCKGLVAMVVNGRTRKFRWSATPALLTADLLRAGFNLRKPPIYHRVGIPGSGGPDWLRDDYESVVCTTKGRLPWSDNTACGEAPKWKPGGAMSNRQKDGTRTGKMVMNATEPKAIAHLKGEISGKLHTKNDGDRMRVQCYTPPERANPGNVIHCKVGGGRMGSDLSHENEAPFPEKLAEFFIKSFCPPGGTVLDPFGGSGTTAAVAKRLGRNFISIDIRSSQADLTKRRLEEVE